MPKPNPLKFAEVEIDMAVAVYIPGVREGLRGVVTGKLKRGKSERVIVHVARRTHGKLEEATIEVDLAQIVPWHVG